MSFSSILTKINIVFTAIFVIVMLIIFRVYFDNSLDYKKYEKQHNSIRYVYCEITQDEAIAMVNAEFGVDVEPIFVEEMSDAYGKTYIWLRKIYLESKLTGWHLLEVYTHELVHYTRYIANEMMVQFLTFKILYESDNAILHEKGKALANEILSNDCYNKAYDCGWYIKEYLENEKYSDKRDWI